MTTMRGSGLGDSGLRTGLGAAADLGTKQKEIERQSVEFFHLLAQQLANSRLEAKASGSLLPVGFVVSGEVDGFPTELEANAPGSLVMAVGFVPSTDVEGSINALVEIIRQRVSDG